MRYLAGFFAATATPHPQPHHALTARPHIFLQFRSVLRIIFEAVLHRFSSLMMSESATQSACIFETHAIKTDTAERAGMPSNVALSVYPGLPKQLRLCFFGMHCSAVTL
jgi:hypothetical protein